MLIKSMYHSTNIYWVSAVCQSLSWVQEQEKKKRTVPVLRLLTVQCQRRKDKKVARQVQSSETYTDCVKGIQRRGFGWLHGGRGVRGSLLRLKKWLLGGCVWIFCSSTFEGVCPLSFVYGSHKKCRLESSMPLTKNPCAYSSQIGKLCNLLVTFYRGWQDAQNWICNYFILGFW